ncbi:MAG: class I SAM-dependent methyltransferase [Spirochaetia bacterium]|nr:class I SAM-dependent methyltransferase [Spirochaetia bacterium]
MTKQKNCKICNSSSLRVFEHTATCNNCRVILYYPYPDAKSHYSIAKNWTQERVLNWYSKSSFYNHRNFTNMLLFVMDESFKRKKLTILDYGGGGGQFALVCKSHFPEVSVYITDISDYSLLKEWRLLNIQIPFRKFAKDKTKFDFIFLNDVFEHVDSPGTVLKQLAGKLKENGKIFIDTPKQFWLYTFTRFLSKTIYKKLLVGTVTIFHLQIWSRKSFELIVKNSGLKVSKYREVSEYTMPADHYLKNMSITNPFLRFMALIFYKNSKWFAKNKIISVLSR